MTAPNNFAINIPHPSVPILDQATGGISRDWYYVILALQARTGGSTGVSSTQLQIQINNTGVENGASIQALATNLSVELALADVSEPANLKPAILMALALSD